MYILYNTDLKIDKRWNNDLSNIQKTSDNEIILKTSDDLDYDVSKYRFKIIFEDDKYKLYKKDKETGDENLEEELSIVS